MTSSRRRWPARRSSSSCLLALDPGPVVGVDQGLGGVAGEDREGRLVVGPEAIPAKPGNDDHALDPAGVGDRDEQHRLRSVDRPDHHPARIAVRLRHEQGLVVLGDPAGQALADPAAKHLGPNVGDAHERALEGDRLAHPALVVDPVDPDVVEVDQVARLGHDRLADRANIVQAVEPAAEGLDRAQAGRQVMRLGSQPGVGDRRGDLVGECLGQLDLDRPARPACAGGGCSGRRGRPRRRRSARNRPSRCRRADTPRAGPRRGPARPDH